MNINFIKCMYVYIYFKNIKSKLLNNNSLCIYCFVSTKTMEQYSYLLKKKLLILTENLFKIVWQ